MSNNRAANLRAIAQDKSVYTGPTVWLEQAANEIEASNSQVAILTRELEEQQRAYKAMKEDAERHCRNELFYREIIIKIGEKFGNAAYISDDGSVQQDVLCLKVPELVDSLRSENDVSGRLLLNMKVELGLLKESRATLADQEQISRRECNRLRGELAGVKAELEIAKTDRAEIAKFRAENEDLRARMVVVRNTLLFGHGTP